jgi:hypothetical protein
MKYLVILLVLFPMLFSCSGAKKQEGYSDNKCFNMCSAGQTCLIDQKDKRFHCSDKGVECSPPCSGADECKNVAGIPTCVPKPTLVPTPGPTPTPGPDPNAAKCTPRCTGFSTCQIDTQTGKYSCVSGSPNPNPNPNTNPSPNPNPNPNRK